MVKNILILVNCFLFCCFLAQPPAISFSIRHLDDKKIELTVTNNSPYNKILLMDTSDLRITDTQNYDLEYEMFLANVLVYKSKGNYAVPFTRNLSSHRDCNEFGKDNLTNIEDYVQSHMLKLRGNESQKIIYNLLTQENIYINKTEPIKKLNFKINVVYNGKKIEQYLKTSRCYTAKSNFEHFSFENITSNTITMSINAQKITPPKR